jgi:hypothetical protein
MLYYLNNWRNRDHARIYGGSAVFDLWADGVEDKRVREMQPGDTCLILSRASEVNVAVSRCVFTNAVRGPDDHAARRGVWILHGTTSGREVLPKADASRHSEYARFFNKLGHVCQWSVLRDA